MNELFIGIICCYRSEPCNWRFAPQRGLTCTKPGTAGENAGRSSTPRQALCKRCRGTGGLGAVSCI